MKLEELLPAFREGEKICRASWVNKNYYWQICKDGSMFLDNNKDRVRYMPLDCLLTDDWFVWTPMYTQDGHRVGTGVAK